MKTCDQCKNWTPEELQFAIDHPSIALTYKDQGYCRLFGDINDFPSGTPAIRNDVCYGEDAESYSASVVVMAKFGCIHWKQKND